jgi:hypothetical protein
MLQLTMESKVALFSYAVHTVFATVQLPPEMEQAVASWSELVGFQPTLPLVASPGVKTAEMKRLQKCLTAMLLRGILTNVRLYCEGSKFAEDTDALARSLQNLGALAGAAAAPAAYVCGPNTAVET